MYRNGLTMKNKVFRMESRIILVYFDSSKEKGEKTLMGIGTYRHRWIGW